MELSFVIGYLDPGTGSIVAQSVIGVIAGVALFGRRLFTNLADKLRSLFGSTKKN